MAGSKTLSGKPFPAHAGVFPITVAKHGRCQAVPRARGGISTRAGFHEEVIARSPRTRGYFPCRRVVWRCSSPFPAHAGVFPAAHELILQGEPVPRARGGISVCSLVRVDRGFRSPRTRGYFHNLLSDQVDAIPFPAHAGVFPVAEAIEAAAVPVPRARGGISSRRGSKTISNVRSPRTRGYFLGV